MKKETIRYKYNEMLEKASEIDKVLPSLIENNDWQGVAEAVKISDSVWSGQAANAYRNFCNVMVENQHKEGTLRIPELIRQNVERMQQKDAEVAALVKRNFSNLL